VTTANSRNQTISDLEEKDGINTPAKVSTKKYKNVLGIMMFGNNINNLFCVKY